MKYGRVLIIFLLAAIIAVSGCIDMTSPTPTTGVNPTLDPNATPLPTPTEKAILGVGVIKSDVVTAVLQKDGTTYQRNADNTQTETYSLAITNTGNANVTNVYFTLAATDGQTGDLIYTSDAMRLGNITPGNMVVSSLTTPSHKWIYNMKVQVTVYWGDQDEYSNALNPWYVGYAANEPNW